MECKLNENMFRISKWNLHKIDKKNKSALHLNDIYVCLWQFTIIYTGKLFIMKKDMPKLHFYNEKNRKKEIIIKAKSKVNLSHFSILWENNIK